MKNNFPAPKLSVLNYFDLFRNCADYFRDEITRNHALATDFDWKDMVLTTIKNLKEHESTEEENKSFNKD